MPAADSELVRDARARHFADNGFSDAAYTSRWWYFPIPNPPGRKRAIPLHDLHHVVTGYATTFVGEAEISAWELGAGCGDHLFVWWIAASAAVVGLVIAPLRTIRAFRRGRRCRSLYNTHRRWHDGLLDRT